MRQPHNLAERESLMFILFLVLMAVLLFGGKKRRQAYDAEHGRPTQMLLDATKHGHPVSAPALNE